MLERLPASTFAAFGAYVVLGVTGLLLLRANLPAAVPLVRGGQLTAHPVALSAAGAVAYASSFATWLVVLSRVPLSVAYPVAVGATLALSSALAWAVLGEPVTLRILLGIVLIFVGVVVVSTA